MRKSARNQKIAARYQAGETAPALAAAYRLSENQVRRILRQLDVRVSREEWLRRVVEGNRRMAMDPQLSQRRIEAVRRAVTAWADCPPHLEADYETLRGYYGARRARQMLEQQL